MTDISHMPLAELESCIARFRTRLTDRNLTPDQRTVFEVALANAEAEKNRRAEKPAPAEAPARPLEQHSAVELLAPTTGTAPATAAVPAPDGQKKNPAPLAFPFAVRTAAGASSFRAPTVVENEIRLECPITVRATKIVFEWGGGKRSELSPRETVGRLKSRLADLTRLKKPLPESPMFYRAAAYLHGLEAYYGREVTAAELRLRNRGAAVLEQVRTEAERLRVASV